MTHVQDKDPLEGTHGKETYSYINTALGPNRLGNHLCELASHLDRTNLCEKSTFKNEYIIPYATAIKSYLQSSLMGNSPTGVPMKSQGYSFSPYQRNLLKSRHAFQKLYSILNFINKNFAELFL